MFKKNRFILLYVGIVFTLVPKCFANEYIEVDGSSTVFPITEIMASNFQKEHVNLKIDVRISGTGGGFKKFCRGETDINDASRKIKSSEIELCAQNNIQYVKFLIAYDGIAVIVNPKNNWLNHITSKELKALWSEENFSSVKEWFHADSKWPERLIRFYGPGKDSGTYDYFCEAILGENEIARKDYIPSEDDNVIVYGVANDKYSIGFLGLAYYIKNQKRLKLLAVDNEKGSGAIYPTQNTILNKQYEPLSRPLYLYINAEKIQKNKILKEFIQYYLTQAPKVIPTIGYVPLSEEQYKAGLKKILF